MIAFFIKIRIGLLHATYHRNMKRADTAREVARTCIKF
jgi:hypothetical protein